MMLGWALAFLTCLAVVLQISGVPIDVSDDEFNFKQVEAVEQLASRLFAPLNTTIGSAFHYQLVSKTDSVLDSFEIATQREADVVTVTVSGTSGVALSAGLYHYLRYYCSSSVTWGRDGSGIHLESTLLRQPLPQLSSPVAFELTKQRYYLNFCTTSYSFAFASLEQWLEEVDWMALHGINLPLATTGTEHTIAEAFGPDGLGLTEQELLDFFPGPAFLAWNRMANLDGPFAGPLSKSWRDKRAVLSRAVFQRMRDFGMNIVLPGFSGHLPCSLQRVFPKMKLSARPHWQGYNSSCLLDPSDPYFPVIATAFYKTQQTIFGPTRYFAADQFNEMEPSSGSTVDYLRNMSASVYEAMTSFQSDAVWVMQAWFVVEIPLCKTGQTAYCKSFWLQNVTSRAYPGPFPRLQAYLSGVPHGSLLILDLEANLYPVYSYTDNFYGHDFIWCTIHNFGQTPGVWGDLRALIEGPLAARHAAPNNMAGIGLTMEGVHNNPAVYEVCTEMAYRNATVDVGAWATTFAQSRYGVATPECQEAWALMVSSGPYSTATQPMQIISSMASLHLVTSSPLPPATVPTANNLTTDTAIARKLLSCGETLRAAGGDVPSTLVYDTVDMVRQSLDGFLWDMSRLFEGVYHRNDTIGAHRVADKWRGVALTLDDVLSADVNFMLGPWIADARATAGGETAAERAREADELDYNARNQITLWGPVPSTGLERYARKQWAGVVKTFYLEGTWGTLLDAALVSLDSHQPVDLAAVAKQTYDIELNWQTNLTLSFPVAPVRNTSGAAMDYIAQLVEPFLNLSSVVASFDRRPNVSALPSLHLLPQTTWSRDVAHMAWLCDADVKCGGFDSDGWLYYQIDPSHDLQPTPTVDLWLRR